MAKQALNGDQVRPGVEQLAGKGMPQTMGRILGVEPRCLSVAFEQALNGARGQRLVRWIGKEKRRRALASVLQIFV
jgi:hypothetical protein